MAKVNLIYAVDLNYALGKAGQIPWHVPEDLARFKQLTQGHTVIMGRKTWDSLPEKMRLTGGLPGRRNYVISRSAMATHIQDRQKSFLSLDEAIKHHSFWWPLQEIWIIGGASIYEEAFPLADDIYETRMSLEIQRPDVSLPEALRRLSENPAWKKRDSYTGFITSETGIKYKNTVYIRAEKRTEVSYNIESWEGRPSGVKLRTTWNCGHKAELYYPSAVMATNNVDRVCALACPDCVNKRMRENVPDHHSVYSKTRVHLGHGNNVGKVEHNKQTIKQNFYLDPRDKTAVATISFWIGMNIAALGESHPKIQSARKTLEAYQNHPEKKQAD